jgi:hypothetical protein
LLAGKGMKISLMNKKKNTKYPFLTKAETSNKEMSHFLVRIDSFSHTTGLACVTN